MRVLLEERSRQPVRMKLRFRMPCHFLRGDPGTHPFSFSFSSPNSSLTTTTITDATFNFTGMNPLFCHIRISRRFQVLQYMCTEYFVILTFRISQRPRTSPFTSTAACQRISRSGQTELETTHTMNCCSAPARFSTNHTP